VGAGARAVGEGFLDTVGQAILSALSKACAKVAEELLHFLSASSGVTFESGWWASERTQHLVRTVAALGAVLMVGFLLLAVIHGLLAGDPGAMLRSALVEVPISVLATAVLVSVTQLLLGVTDESANLVLARVPEDLGRFFEGFADTASLATHGLAGMVILALFLMGALLVWVELLVRSSLIYWLAAAAPLLAAARVWPGARGAFRKLCEIGLALIISKFAIALALGLGAAALSGGGPREGDLGTKVGMDLAGLLGGAVLMGLAAFTPFVLLRLLPILEVAVAAQGISRSPARAAQAGMQGAYYLQGIERMAGAHRGPSGGGPAGADAHAAGPGPAGPAGPPGAAGAAGSTAGGAAAGGAPAAGAATAAAGPAAAAAAVPVGAAAAATRAARTTADNAATPAGRGSGS